jgi:bifunctional non-homologous end joining protein LigD
VRVNGRNLILTNLDKVLWPREKISKAEVIKYYADLSEYIIAFLKDRPIMTRRYPHGITQEYFVQKHFPHVPEWVNLFSFKSEHYVLCNDLPTLIWLGNLAAIEINHMLAKSPNVTRHDLVLIDLDPHLPAKFEDARVAARGVATVLERLELEFLTKTSGADGIHFLIPIERRYSVEKIRKFVYAIGKLIEKANPNLATVSTRADRKKGHVYVDFLQNGLEKTITAPLSIRALPEATVSYPLTVKQLDDHKLNPQNFTLRNAPRRSTALRNMLHLSRLSQDFSPVFRKLGIKN